MIAAAQRARAMLMVRRGQEKTAAQDSSAPKTAEQIAEDKRRDRARAKYLSFVCYTMPDYRVNWHHEIMAEALERFAKGECKRLIIVAPPQAAGKSQLGSRHLAPFILGVNPDARVIQGSNTYKLASKMTRASRKIMLSREYFELFPESRLKSSVRGRERDGYVQTSQEFEVVGHRGSLLSTGAKGAIVGNPATHAICDDIIAGRKAADSPTQREDVWEWLEQEIRHRVGAAGGICLIGTRWHEDDPIGRLLKKMADDPEAEQWEVVNLPAEYEVDEKNPQLYPVHRKDPRKPGDPLWCWYYAGQNDKLSKSKQEEKAKAFLKAWKNRDARDFATQAQGRPKPREGVLIKWEWFQTIIALPRAGRIIRYWDLAGTAKDVKRKNHDPDFCAGGLLVRMKDKRTCLADMKHFRMDVGARDVELLRIAREDLKNYPERGLKWWIETEGGIGGVQRTRSLIRALQALGLSVEADPIPETSKLYRADPMISAIKAGNLVLLEGPWNEGFKAEAAIFTGLGETHDDQIDAVSGGLSKLIDSEDDYSAFEGMAS